MDMQDNVDCISCFDNLQLSSCISCPEGHHICLECFQHSACSQMSTFRLFEQRQCKFKCAICTHIFPKGFDSLNSDSIATFAKTMRSIRQASAQRAQQLQQIKDEEQLLLTSKDQEERVAVHFNEIVRVYFDMTCPGCRGGFDLESINYAQCMGLFCQCGVIFCMWCNASVGSGYGHHVTWCGLNPSRGVATSNLEQVKAVKNAAIRTQVPVYLQNNVALESDRTAVLEKLAPLLQERGIAL